MLFLILWVSWALCVHYGWFSSSRLRVLDKCVCSSGGPGKLEGGEGGGNIDKLMTGKAFFPPRFHQNNGKWVVA